jgi:site-specific DNA-methyltransferase (adenine-specific)
MMIHGDCIEEMRKFSDKQIDVVVTSPPYNLKIQYNLYDDNKKASEYFSWLESVFIEIHRILSDDGSFFLNVGFSSLSPWLDMDVANLARKNFQLQNRIAWIKSIHVEDKTRGHFKPINSSRFLNNNHEMIFHFTKTGKTKIDRLAVGVPYEDKSNVSRWESGNDLRCNGNNWFISYKTVQSKEEKGNHPAIFPIELPKRCILLHGVRDGLNILDPFAGTGTTLLASREIEKEKNVRLLCYGIELDESYIQEFNRRIGE